MMNGKLIKYIATPMRMTLIIRIENGEEVTHPLDDDLFMGMIGNHEPVSYIPADAGAEDFLPNKVTCEIENGVVTRTVIETEDTATEE